VCTVRVVVDTTVEHGSSVLSESRLDHRLTTRVVLDEVGDIVDNTSDRDETAAILGLLDIVVPFHDGELVKRSTPVELGALLINLLLKLLNAALLDLVGAELLQVEGEAELLASPDGPLGGVVLVPFDGVAVVGWELVVEIVVTFAEGNEGRDDVITRRVTVVEGLVTEPVGEGVHAESGLLDEENTQDTGVHEAAVPVTPAETGNQHGHDETHEEDDLEVVAVLPDDNRVFVEITDIGAANSLGVLLHEHPSEVGIHEALADGVGVLIGVGVTVVSTVVSSPPANGAFDGTATDGGEPDAKGQSGGVGAVSPETVVS
jgi:hypothetical protein